MTPNRPIRIPQASHTKQVGIIVFPARKWELSPNGGWSSRAATAQDRHDRLQLAIKLNCLCVDLSESVR